MNLKLLIFIIVCIAGAIAIFVLLGYTGIWPNIISDFVLPKLQGTAVTDALTNPVTLATTAGGIVTAGGVALNQINKVKQDAQQTAQTTQNQITALESQKTQLQQTISEQQTKIESLSKTTPAAPVNTTQIADLEKQVRSAQEQAQTIQNSNQQFIHNLMAASNGALVTNPVDGKIYSVLKVPPEVIIK